MNSSNKKKILPTTKLTLLDIDRLRKVDFILMKYALIMLMDYYGYINGKDTSVYIGIRIYLDLFWQYLIKKLYYLYPNTELATQINGWPYN